MTWELKLPVRDEDEVVSTRTIELADHLADDDAAICRELLWLAREVAHPQACTVGMVAQVLESFDNRMRRATLNVCRHRAGLPMTKAIEDQAAFEAAQKAGAARLAETSPWQVCAEPTCKAVPVDSTGLQVPVDVRRWWCSNHIHLASEDDMSPRPPALRMSASGTGLVDVAEEEAEQAREQARAESRRRQREAQQAERAVEAAERAEFEKALAETWKSANLTGG